MRKKTISVMLFDLIRIARSEYGEPTYKYFRREYAWRCRTRKPRRADRHTLCVSSRPPECTLEEYKANVEQGKRDATEAFMGRLPQTYYTWERKLTNDGWPQKLIAMIEEESKSGIEEGGE